MPAGMIAYLRVSTESQGRSGLGLEAQRAAVEKLAGQYGQSVVHEYLEIETGKIDNRPQLNAAIQHCRRVRGTLVVAKLDRLSRNATFLLAFDDMIKRAGIDFLVCDTPHLDRFMLGVHALVAERERLMISDRTKAALAAAKARGVRLGTRSGTKLSAAGLETRRAKAKQFAQNVAPIIAQIRAAGASSLTEIANALNARGVMSPNGGIWYANSVRRIECQMTFRFA